MRRLLVGGLLVAVFTALLENRAWAENLVLNGGFEEEWVPGPPLHWDGNGILFPFPHSGFNAAAFTDSQVFDGLGQVVPTTPGSIYLVDFWLANPSFGGSEPPNNNFSVSFGTSGISWVNAPFFDYTEFSFTAQALGTQTTLQFLGRNQPTSWFFDDVSVTLIPEPSGFVLAAVGFVGLTFALAAAVQLPARSFLD
jgi:hypothetical protein